MRRVQPYTSEKRNLKAQPNSDSTLMAGHSHRREANTGGKARLKMSSFFLGKATFALKVVSVTLSISQGFEVEPAFKPDTGHFRASL